MDDGLFGFLVFVGIMVASIVYQKRKLAMEEAADEKKSAPIPKVIIKDLTKPRVKTSTVKQPKKPTFQPSSDFIGRNNYVKDELKTPVEKPVEKSEYAFESLDEVKKAFVWSEILKRKY
jgi:hypothetical protein